MTRGRGLAASLPPAPKAKKRDGMLKKDKKNYVGKELVGLLILQWVKDCW